MWAVEKKTISDFNTSAMQLNIIVQIDFTYSKDSKCYGAKYVYGIVRKLTPYIS